MEVKNIKFAASVLMASIALAGCSDDPKVGGGNDLVEINLSRSEKEAAEAMQDFAFDFLRESVKENRNGNVVVSPFSMSSTWAMLANGAGGSTRDEIITTLGFDGIGISDVNNYYAKMFASLPEHDNTAEIQIINGLFQNSGFSMKHEFASVIESAYSAEVEKVNGDEWNAAINAWVSAKTNGKIPCLLPEDQKTPGNMAVANALNFNGKWTYGFDTADTRDAVFHNVDSTESMVPFMYKEMVGICYDEDAYLIELYFGNGAYSMLFILPEDGVGIPDYLTTFNSDKMNSLYSNVENVTVKMRLPKFDVSSQFDARVVLGRCGLREAISDEADYSGISDNYINIVQSMHGCAFKIDEDGATASAATIDTGSPSAVTPPSENMELTFDRPFIYVLREVTTKTILMAGVINKL